MGRHLRYTFQRPTNGAHDDAAPGEHPFNAARRHPVNPSGQQLRISSGDYAAVVTEVGACLRELTFRGEHVTKPFGPDERMQLHRGAVLAPWPNRVGDGKYSFGGLELQLPITEVPRHCALHGLVCWHAWTIGAVSAAAVTLTTRIWPQPGYEFTVDLQIEYALTAEDGLTITLTAMNAGAIPAPFGASIHPYLMADGALVDDYVLTVPAASVVDVDPERLLPTGGTTPVAGGAFDFREPRLVGATELDDAFCDVIPGLDGLTVATVVGALGRGSQIVWDPTQCPWVQVHTADRPDARNNRVAMAIEPMTCPPDAFRSGEGLITLDPGASTSVWWTIRDFAG